MCNYILLILQPNEMGSLNSIPVISQVKSLVQVIGGDVDGARQTQNDFINKGIVASQVKSLVHAIQGDNEAARETQRAFGGDLLQFAENTPVVGHITSGVHAIMGDQERARKVALGATKSTVVALAGAAGAVCGPAAFACGATFAVGSGAGWDGVDSAIAGEKRGIIKGTYDLATGNTTIGEAFDTIAGTGLTAVGGGLTAKFVANKLGGPNIKVVCRRSVAEETPIFATELPDLDENLLKALPPSLNGIDLDRAIATPNDLIITLFNIFVILKLISIGHPRARPYYDEICGRMYPNEELTFCEEKLYLGLQKFGRMNRKENLTETETFFEDSFDSLMFEMKNMVRNTPIGDRLDVAVCAHFANLTEIQACNSGLHLMMKKLKKGFADLDSAKIRKKRQTCTNHFYTKHTLHDGIYQKFKVGDPSLLLRDLRGLRDLGNHLNTRMITLIPDETLSGLDFSQAKPIPRNPTLVTRFPNQVTYVFDNVELLNVERVGGPNSGVVAKAGMGNVELTFDIPKGYPNQCDQIKIAKCL